MAHQRVYLDKLKEARGGRFPIDHSIHPQVPDRVIAVASDWHVPYHDDQLIARMLERCADEKIKTLVVPGDSFDMPYFSSFDQTDLDAKMEEDFKTYRGIIDVMFEVFDHIYILPGNHDDRFFRQLKWQTGMDGLLRHVGLQDYIEEGRLRVYNDPTIMAMGDTWMITHPYAYGRQPLIIPGLIADLYGVNVMSAHSHHWGMGRSPSGRFIVVETGGLFRPEYHEYKQKRINPLRPWIRGYWILKDGVPIPGY
jgi:predicted phosphodiesterase